MRYAFALLLGVAAVGGSGKPAADDDALRARGAALFDAFECGHCHTAVGRAPHADRGRSCSGCHAWIAASRYDGFERARGRETFRDWDAAVRNVESYLAVPDLAAAGARLDRRWIARYLRDPYQIRPGLKESMIRAPLGDGDAEALAAFLGSSRPARTGKAAAAAAIPVSTAASDLAEGERLYAAAGCASCHAFGRRAPSPGVPAAPDLAHARNRMRPADIAAFIADPAAFGGRVTMPDHDLSPRDAARLRDFLVGAPLDPPAPAEFAARPSDARPAVDGPRFALPGGLPPAPLPLLARPVGWDEVSARVFSRTCVHCHLSPERNAGDGGAGNTGGLGFRGVGLELDTWEGARRGAIGADGRRRSILDPDPVTGEPPLRTRLRARAHEWTRERSPTRSDPPSAAPLGMPLGLAPLSPEEMQLVETWLAQGAPRGGAVR